jgi:hypothetical protein
MKNIIGIIIGCMIVLITLAMLIYSNPGQAGENCPIPTQEITPTNIVFPTPTNIVFPTATIEIFPTVTDVVISTIEIIPTEECTPTPKDTLTPVSKLFPTPTIPRLFFTPTNIPEGTATVIIPTFTDSPDPQKHKTKTPSPTVVLVYQTPIAECSNNCLCLLVTQAVIANDLQRTQIAVDLEQNSCPIP